MNNPHPRTIVVSSSAFKAGKRIPPLYTCNGEDYSPPLSWKGIPEGTKSIAVIVDSPDAPEDLVPGGIWIHWVVFNLPPDLKGLPERASVQKYGAIEGTNSWRKIGYGGPCPMFGIHRYYFKVYALDTKLDLDEKATKEDLLKAMEGHVLAKGQIMGRYKLTV